MAQLQRRDPESNGQGDIVRSWDAEASGFPGGSPQGSSQSFKKQAEEILDLLRRRKWLIILTCLAVVSGAALYTYSQVPVYSTNSLVLVDKEKQAGGAGAGMSGGQGSGLLPSAGNSLENELLFLRNSQSLRVRVARRLVERGDAERVLEAQGTSPVGRLKRQVMASMSQVLGLGEEARAGDASTSPDTSADEPPSASEVAPALAGRVEFARASQETNVVQVAAQDESPEVARLLADLYVEEYIELTKESSRARVSASRQFLQKRARELEQELEQIERRIQEYQRRENAISLDQRQGNLAGQIADTETQLEQARIELRMERSSLESLRDELESIQPDQLSERVASTVRQEIEALQAKIAELELSKQQIQLQSGAMTRADSAQAAQIDERIQKLRARISNLSNRYVDQVMAGGLSPEQGAQRVDDLKRRIAERQIQISGLESRIDVLSDRLQEYERDLNEIPEKAMELAQLQRDQRYAEQMYGFVTKQLQEVRVREKSELGYATRVAEAPMPGTPVRPRPRRNIFLGLIVGLLGGGGLALIRDQMDNRLYKPDQIREMGYPQAGIIPNLQPLIEDQMDGQPTVEWEGHQLESSLVGVLKPYSAATEAYRKVWTNLQLGRPDGSSSTILITSAGSGDGKSITASNLAVVTAQAGHSTLLIDGDLRRPRLHEVFDISRTPGITEALQNDFQEQSLRTPLVDNLFVLPAGTEVDNPTEVLGSSRFREFLEHARQHFDHIIVDSSPVLATSDGPLLSDLCDTTLCVARAGTTTEAELEDALDTLYGVGADIGGVVFNGFDISMAYGYKYRYRHYGQYGPYDQYRSLPEASAAEG